MKDAVISIMPHLLNEQQRYGFMMKTKCILQIVYTLFIGWSLAFTSCTLDQDDDIANLENNAAGTFSTLGTVYVNEELITIESDRYGTLIPENAETITAIDADSTGQRILIGFVYLNEANALSVHESYPVRIVDLLYKVETRFPDILAEEETSDRFGNAPLQIVEATTGKNHLNIQYRYNGSTDAHHRFSLVIKENETMDAEGLLTAEFRHDTHNDLSNETCESIISFTLESLDTYASSACKGFRILYNSGANKQAEWKVFKNEE